MKIVFLSHDSNCNAGAQMCLFDLIRGIKTEYPSAKLYLITRAMGTMIEFCSPYIDDYHIIPNKWWMFRKQKSILRRRIHFAISCAKSQPKIRHWLNEIKPDLTLTNTIVLPQLAKVSKELGIKHIWFIHEIPMLSSDKLRFIYSTKKILSLIEDLSFKILVTSNFANNYYRQAIDSNKIVPIDQSVNIKKHPCDTRSDRERYTLLMVGAIESNKGQMELLGAVKKITESGQDIRCHFVGAVNQIDYMKQCQKYIAVNNLVGVVEFSPFTQNIAQYYCKADLLIGCSSMETFFRTAVEAQMHGLPVVLSNVGANPERIIEGVNGFTYEKGSIDSLVEKIEFLRDPARRKEFSKNLPLLNLEKHTTAAFAQSFISIAELEP